jgi:hypothetical protein
MKQRSWKTTAAGVGAILTAIGTLLASGKLDGQAIATAVAAILGGLGLLFARDNDKTSEQVGAAPGATPPNVTPLPPQTPAPQPARRGFKFQCSRAGARRSQGVLEQLNAMPVSFTNAQPLADAVSRLAAKTPIGALLKSADWQAVPLALRERAFFSATVTSAEFLDQAARGVLEIAQIARRTMEDGSEGAYQSGKSSWRICSSSRSGSGCSRKIRPRRARWKM